MEMLALWVLPHSSGLTGVGVPPVPHTVCNCCTGGWSSSGGAKLSIGHADTLCPLIIIFSFVSFFLLCYYGQSPLLGLKHQASGTGCNIKPQSATLRNVELADTSVPYPPATVAPAGQHSYVPSSNTNKRQADCTLHRLKLDLKA